MNRDGDTKDLRARAEALLKGGDASADTEPAESLRLVHELQVHQIELEMQNSALLENHAELEAALARYTTLYDFAPAGYFTLDRHGAIQRLNLAGARLLGAPRSALKGRAFSGYVDFPSQAEFAALLHRAVTAGDSAQGEIVLVHPAPSTEQVFVHLEVAPGETDDTVNLVAVDVSALRRAREALDRQTEILHCIADSTPDLVYTVDRDCRLQYINRVPAGLDPPDVIGTDVTRYVAAEHQDRVRRAIAQVFESGLAGRFEALARGPHDRPTWYETVVAPVFQGREVAHAALLSRDITERIEAARRLRALSRRLIGAQETARRRLAGELHDRTSANLAAIIINMDAAALAMEQREWDGLAERLADNRALVEDTAASIREICTELRPPALDYAGLVPALESYVAQFGQRTGIPVAFRCEGREEKLAPATESALFRIAQEALTNVAKHAGAARAAVELDLGARPLRLAVSDDGHGFETSFATTTPGATGGQGIITMREMAEFSGGTFTLHSRPGEGTRIIVYLPDTEGMP